MGIWGFVIYCSVDKAIEEICYEIKYKRGACVVSCTTSLILVYDFIETQKNFHKFKGEHT